jgi:LacI family transcriptional regulator
MVVQTPLNLDAVHAATLRLSRRSGPPTAVGCNFDYAARAVYKAARAMGVRVGTHLSVVGHDDLPTSELLDPPLATLHLDRRAPGWVLMTRLLEFDALDHRETGGVGRACSMGPGSAISACRGTGRGA